MKKFSVLSIIVLFAISMQSQTARNFFTTPQTLKHENGKVKEQADWKDGLIIGYRKFFNKEGQLIEQHYFGKDSIEYTDGKPTKGMGYLKCFYPKSGKMSIMMPVYQSIKVVRGVNEYDFNIDYDIPIFGYYESGNKMFEFTLERPYTLNSNNDLYSSANQFFPNVLAENSNYMIDGMNANIKYFFEDGKLKAEGSFKSARKAGVWKFYYPNGKIESTGEYMFKGTQFDIKIGLWKYYSESGTLLKEEEYCRGGTNKKIKMGDYLNHYKLYDESGNLKLHIRYPSLNDVNIYTDTIEVHFSNGKLMKKYDETTKTTLFTGQPYNFSGKYEEHYSNGNLKEIGFYSKIPRAGASENELKVNPCIMQNNKRIGRWYFFNEQGQMTSIIEYDFCGNIKKEIDKDRVESENSKYRKGNYEFDFTIKM
jgi:antitoxin component YwqK of YwqJK toxin-antitoxin module